MTSGHLHVIETCMVGDMAWCPLSSPVMDNTIFVPAFGLTYSLGKLDLGNGIGSCRMNGSAEASRKSGEVICLRTYNTRSARRRIVHHRACIGLRRVQAGGPADYGRGVAQPWNALIKRLEPERGSLPRVEIESLARTQEIYYIQVA